MAVSEYPNMPSVSHTFNQLLAYKDGKVLFLDHGDANPRALRLTLNHKMIFPDDIRNNINPDINLFSLQGRSGDNYTGTTVTGFETGTKGVLVLGNSVPHDNAVKGVTGSQGLARNIYLITRNTSDYYDMDAEPREVNDIHTFKWLTSYDPNGTMCAAEPRMVKLSEDRFIILYSVYKNGTEPSMHYKLIDSAGNILASQEFVGVIFSAASVPVKIGNKLKWVERRNDGNNNFKAYLVSLNIQNTANPTLEKGQWPVLVSHITLNKTSVTLKPGATETLTANMLPANASNKGIQWMSDRTAIATVSNSGVITGVQEGTATITATATDGSGKQSSARITVTAALPTPTPPHTSTPTPTPQPTPTSGNGTPTPTGTPNSPPVASVNPDGTHNQPSVTEPTQGPGWHKLPSGQWMYYNAQGNAVTDWQQVDGDWYFFGQNGYMKTGWLQQGGTWYYLKSSGAMATGWVKAGSYWSEFSSGGKWLRECKNNTGWQQYAKGWCFQINNLWATGWKLIDGQWYCFDSTAYMMKGWQHSGGRWYFFKSSGVMATGWQQSGSAWYYLKTSGHMAAGEWIQIGGKWYYLKPSGIMAANETLNIGGKAYRFSAGGVWIG